MAAGLTTVTFNPGQVSRTITVQVNGDVLDESNETFFLNLSNAANATIADPQALGTITDDDAFPTVAVSDAVAIEGDSGTVTATFTVTLNAPSGRGLSVDYATADGTASSPADYVPASGTVNFAAGETSKTVSVLVNGDQLDEIDETFTLSLSNGVNVTIGDGSGLGTISDDDPAAGAHDRRRHGRRRRQRHDRGELHGHAQRRERAPGHGQLRIGRRHRDRAGRLRAGQRLAELRSRADDEDGHRQRER